MQRRQERFNFCESSIFDIGTFRMPLHIEHLPRMSDWGAEVTDGLSRQCTTTKQDAKLVKDFHNRNIPSCLKDWFLSPTNDWQLAVKLLEHVEKLI